MKWQVSRFWAENLNQQELVLLIYLPCAAPCKQHSNYTVDVCWNMAVKIFIQIQFCVSAGLHCCEAEELWNCFEWFISYNFSIQQMDRFKIVYQFLSGQYDELNFKKDFTNVCQVLSNFLWLLLILYFEFTIHLETLKLNFLQYKVSCQNLYNANPPIYILYLE